MLSRKSRLLGIFVLVALLMSAAALELNLLGVTQFPFETGRSSDSERDHSLSVVLRKAKAQCRFGSALASATRSRRPASGRRSEVERFASTYARSIAGATRGERQQIREACLKGLRGPRRRS